MRAGVDLAGAGRRAPALGAVEQRGPGGRGGAGAGAAARAPGGSAAGPLRPGGPGELHLEPGALRHPPRLHQLHAGHLAELRRLEQS